MNNAPNSVAEDMGQTEFPLKNDLLDGVRVLMIDDDKHMRSAIGRLVDNWGEEFTTWAGSLA